MTVCFRDEITSKEYVFTDVEKIIETNTGFKVYVKSRDGRMDWNTYNFSSVVFVRAEEKGRENNK